MKEIDFIQKILAHAEENPEKIAVFDHDGKRMTSYRELVEKAKRMAHYLSDLKLPTHSYILICLPKSVETIIAELGVWLSGHVIVPTADHFPKDRIDYISEHCKSPLIITMQRFEEAMQCDDQVQVVEVERDDEAQLFYTSGSLGNPKGIVHTFDMLQDMYSKQMNIFNISQYTDFAHGAPFYFIASVCYFMTLYENIHLHILENRRLMDVDLLKEYIEQHQIKGCFISPAVLRNCGTFPPCLQTVFTGSEKLSDVDPRGYRLYNCYGMTETGGLSTFFEVDKAYDNTPVGKPAPGVKVTIRDKDGNILPPGEEGEICMEGKFAKCYLNEPEKTAELYRGGILHTSDLGLILPDGNLQYVNRIDWMVKINGHRVEPGEVESAMKNIDGVKDAIVKGFGSDTGSQYICAYYIPEKDIEEKYLIAELEKKLPEYMIPSFFVQMTSFPINANGKVNRKVLLPPNKDSLHAAYVAPETETQKKICAAYEKILHEDKIGLDDDFFRLGGDSIRVVMLQQQCADLGITSKMVFAARTPRELAIKSEQQKHLELKRLREYPLSQSQMGIYVECMNRKGEAVYNNPFLFKLKGAVDLPKVKDSVERTIAAHPHVLTRLFLNADNEPMQRRIDESDFRIEIESLSEEKLQALKTTLVRPFDLLKDRLVRARLFQTEKAIYLFIDFHHIIFDGTSFAVLAHDLNEAYHGVTLEPEPFSGFEVAQEESILLKSDQYQEAKDWYEKTFIDMDVESLPMPDRTEGTVRFASSSIEKIDFESLSHFCEKEGVTMNVLTTAAFGYLLGSYMNTQEALFATIYNGRSDLKTSRTIAMMVKTLPVYCSWKGEISVHDYLQQIKTLLLTAMQHDIYSFAELCGKNNTISSQVLFAYQGDLDFGNRLFGVPYEEIPLQENATGEKLMVQLFKSSDQTLRLIAEYHANLYSSQFIDSFLKCYIKVLQEFITKQQMSDLEVVPDTLLQELDAFNQTEVPYDTEQTIVSLFRKATADYPNHIAIEQDEEAWTYERLDAVSEKIASYIHELGLGKGDVVSILIPRCPYIATASLGALKASCCYQPLDPSYPSERLNFMMKDANSCLLITVRDLRPLVDEYKGTVVYLDEIDGLPVPDQPLEDPRPNDAFTLLYTSGTTGLPKGCRLTHANLVCFCHWYQRALHLTTDDSVGAYASYGFDANMMDMYSAITIGATCVLIGEEIRLDFPILTEYLAKHHVTHLFMTTQVGRQFASDYPTHPSLRHLMVGGEKLTPITPPSGYQFYNVYGPTECTIFTTIHPMNQLEEIVPIGKPLDNFHLYVVDKNGHRLPTGALGELRIAGPQVSEGYLNRPELTGKVFVTNPFAENERYKNMYCSGDVVRYLTDGNIEFVGRKDAQVKIRGFRIELTEVEAVIREFPGIQDVTVVAFDDPNGGKFIAAYVVSDKTIDVNDLNRFVAERKPPYMVPAVTMQIDRIPLNQNMKVNKRALPEPKLEVKDDNEDNREPNVLEKQLQDIIGGIIRMDHFSYSTELTFLGLTSILSIKLAANIYKRFGVTLPSKFLMHGATLLSIENEIIQAWMNGQVATMENQPKEKVEIQAVPLTYSQSGVYYECMKHPTDSTYNIPFMLVFDPSMDPDRLESAVRKVMEAHPSVMTHFEMRDQEVMAIRDHQEISISRDRISENEVDQYKNIYLRPFNLSKAPLFRLGILQTEKHVILLGSFHHLIFDGSSLDLFIRNLQQTLEGETIEKETLDYFTFADEERKAEAEKGYAANHDFFHQMLCHCDAASEIPADRTNKQEDGGFGQVIHPIDGNGLNEFCRTHQITPATLCLAAVFYTCSRYINNKDVYICTISNGRSDLRTTDTFGMFVKTLPLAIHIADQTIEEFIQESGQLLSDTILHESYPFARIASDYNYTPQIMYACQLGVMKEDISIDGKPVSLQGMELEVAKFKLAIHIEEVDGNPAIVLQYNDAVYSTALMRTFAASMAIVLHQLMEKPKLPVKKISLLDAESQSLVESFRDTGEPHIGLYHEAIEKNAITYPERTALISVDATFTYKELNVRANRIAHALIAKGVRCGDRVALLLPRTSRIILSMFGVLKAGAAYIPCDPEYPVDRINHILNDSESAYVITTADRMKDFEPEKTIDIEELLEEKNEANPKTGVTPDDLVYLIYTSGSTGKPKGVMLHHGGLCNYLTADPHNVHVHALVNEASIFLSVTTVSFDMSLKEIGTTLYNGLTLVFADEQQANNPILLAELFKKTKADAFNATPSRMMQYIELPDFREALSHCKVVMCGGEKYPDQLLTRLRNITKSRIFNTYGPTEITVSSNGKDLTHSDIVTIGKPLCNYQEFIVDSDGNELPPHVVGELYIGGIGVARGYQHLDQMTTERFIDYKGVRVYKSGDYARWTSDGEVVVLGRSDTQVKLRGLRIELGEVESNILKYPGISNTIVLIRKINGTEHLCAYFTADSEVDIEQLKDTLKKTLTPYMVPTAYLQMEVIPLTPNGKIDVKHLPEPKLLTITANEAPINETERILCDIFAEVLNLEKIGATDNYFELGGTSLSVTSVIIKANNQGLRIAYGDVFTHPTPRDLASLFDKENEKDRENKKDNAITNFDYAALQSVLDANNLNAFLEGKQQPIGNVLLTGGTGFLGIHILHTLITQETGKIYCLLRPKHNLSAEERLQSVLFYYFENAYEELFGKRIFVVQGDVTRPESLEGIKDFPIDTVFNCAANVKHFAAGDEIERVNVGGVKTLLNFCKTTGARLIQVSTMSVGGMISADHPNAVTGLHENQLYIEQLLDNKYIRSKFLAECLILDAIRKDNISAKIMRVGNLSARSTDGEFQINFSTNTFMGRLKSFNILHKCAYEMLDYQLEFSPIDEVAKAIVTLAITPKECCVFHPYNHHFILLGDVLNLMAEINKKIEPVEIQEYKAALAEAEADPEKAKILSSIVAYENTREGKEMRPTKKNNTYTMQILYRLGYRWPFTSSDYILRLLKFLNGMGFFDE